MKCRLFKLLKEEMFNERANTPHKIGISNLNIN
jgi:hypothetical protein